MFGEKFYKYLEELNNWQSSLYSLCLAQRLLPNFLLYCDTTDNHQAKNSIIKIISTMWIFHTDKTNHINLEDLIMELEHYIPNPTEDGPYGAFPALDFCVALGSSINSIINYTGEESIEACKASVCTVAKFLEIQDETEYSDEELYELPLMEEELDFQVSLLKRIRNQKREFEFLDNIRKEFESIKISNIGISIE
ncbi:MAG: DUF416 family protein [Succinivibrionaceae bacterium]